MKQFKYFAMAAAGMLLATSCANEEMPVPQGDGVTFTLRLPVGMTTRASSVFADGKDAVNLTYAVYKSDGHALIMSETINNFFDGNKLENTLSLDLLTGETYDIVFWAQSSTDAYKFESTTADITVDYSKVTSNSEEFDAFWTVDKNFTVTGPSSKTVTLYRPFAQINFGTSDLSYPAVTKEFGADWASLQTTLSLSGVPDNLNLLTGEVSGSADYTKTCGIPSGQPFPEISGYTGPALGYLSMNYVLIGKEKDVKDLVFTVENSATSKIFNTIQVAAAPLQANYRTNVFGKLLTTSTEFQVVIDPIFNAPDYDLPQWDGSVEIPEITDNVMTITTPAELAGMAKMVKEGNRLSGVTINLANDIDLNNIPWTPVGSVGSYPSDTFSGTFDGQGHTIFNLNASSTGNLAAAGLFGSITGKVKNLTVENFTVTSEHYAGAIVGYSSTNVGMEITNCHAVNGTITSVPGIVNGSYDNGDKVGGIIGYSVTGDVISDCSVKDVTLTAYRDLGGIVGAINPTVSNCTVSDCTLILSDANDYGKPASERFAGEIIGRDSGATLSGNTFTNVNIIRNANTISTPAQLAAIAANVNNGDSYAGKTIVLTADINLAGVEWTPIGNTAKPFQGTFDGNGHTVSNLTIDASDTGEEGVGFIGHLNGGTVKNLNFKGASIKVAGAGTSSPGAAVVAGKIFPSGLIEGCTVENSTIDCCKNAGAMAGYAYGNFVNNTVVNCNFYATLGGTADNDKVGGIVGYQGEGNYRITGNIVKGSTLFGIRNIGGVAGCVQSGVTVDDNTVENSFVYFSSIIGSTAGNSGSYSNGTIVGRAISLGSFQNNVATNVVCERKTSL